MRSSSRAAKAAIPFIIGALFIGAGSLPAQAGGKLCKVDHYHLGIGNTKASLQHAKVDAVRAWQSFTAWEYGTAWNKFSASMQKSFSCSRSSGGGYSCTVRAKPCRSGRQQLANETTVQKVIGFLQR